MVNISPSTLSVIAAALSGERAFANATHSRIEEALQSLLPGNTSTGSIDLQPGEYYLVIDEDDLCSGVESYHSAEDFEDFVNDMQLEMENRDFDDRFSVYIIRKEVNVETERKTKVTIS